MGGRERKRGDGCVMRVELPESFEKRMQEMLGDEYESYIESYDNPRQYDLINPMKITEEELAEGSGFSDPIPWTKTGYFYKEEDQPARHPYYSAGLYYLYGAKRHDSGGEKRVEPGERVLICVRHREERHGSRRCASGEKVCWWQMISVIPGLKHC